ncbi:MAG: glycosyltransferase family 4 protein [Nitrospinota bacterium]
MHIAFLNSWYTDAARGSGTAAAVSGLARGLESLGHRVTRVESRLPAPGLTLRRLLYNAEFLFRPPAEGCDLLVGFDIDGFLLPAARRRNFVLCLFGVSAEEMRFERGWPRAYIWALSRLEGRNARRAGRVIVPSEHSRRAAIDAYALEPGRVAVVPLGIDLAAWDALAASASTRTEARPTILTVARQYPRKNTRAIIAALPAVRREVPGVLLRVVGGGPMLPALREQAADLGLSGTVEFLGAVSGDDAVRREFFQADVFCLPSLQEGFGLVFLEAMAAGLPIVAAAAGAVPEVAPDGEAARLIPPGDDDALSAALIGLLKDEEGRKRMGAAGRARVRRYDWVEVAHSFVQSVS